MLTRRRNLLAVAAGATLANGIGLPVAARADDLTRGRAVYRQTRRENDGDRVLFPDLFALRRLRRGDDAEGKVRADRHRAKSDGCSTIIPLDQIALLAAQVARYLPVDRYEPFVDALFATQDRWAFARDANHTEELWKTAGLAGMSRATFDKAVADNDLKNWILKQQQADQDKWKIELDSQLRDQRNQIRGRDELRRVPQTDPGHIAG